MSEINGDISFARISGGVAERMKIKIELISKLEKLLVKIVKAEGYQEKADGCDQALDEVKRYFDWIE